jgi:hypothetical protein
MDDRLWNLGGLGDKKFGVHLVSISNDNQIDYMEMERTIENAEPPEFSGFQRKVNWSH